MPLASTPGRPSRHGPPKSSHMGDKLRHAPTLGPSDSISRMSRGDRDPFPEPPPRHAGARHGAPGHHSRDAPMPAPSIMSGVSLASKAPSHLSWAAMSHASGGGGPSPSRGAPGPSRGAPSRRSPAAQDSLAPPPSGRHAGGAFSDDGARSAYRAMSQLPGSYGNVDPPGHRPGAPMSMLSGASGRGARDPPGHRPEAPMSMLSGAGGRGARDPPSHRLSAPMSQMSGMGGGGSHVSPSRHSLAPAPNPVSDMSMVPRGDRGMTSHRSNVPSSLSRSAAPRGVSGMVSTPSPRRGETMELSINIRTTRH